MALAEARAAWQRTANRCLVQEDAKRAPKLACCSSMPPPLTQVETGPNPSPTDNIIPSTCSPPFDLNLNPSYSGSKWWLQMPPIYGYHKGKMEEQFISLENNCRSWKIPEILRDSTTNEEQTPRFESLMDNQCRNTITCEKKHLSVKEDSFGAFCNWNCQDNQKLNAKQDFGELSDEYFLSEVSKCSSDLYFDSESSWIGGAKNAPWWRTADAEELALLVAQRSHDLIDNCDLPRPQNTRSKKDFSLTGTGNAQYLGTSNHKPGNLTAKNYCKSLRMTVGDQSALLRHVTVDKRMMEVQAAMDQHQEDDTSKAQLLEALRHSQTRAREAEQVTKQACAEKEHVIKLVLRQASQLFAYKQWIQLVQLENMYFESQEAEASTLSIRWLNEPLKRRRRRRKMQNKLWSRERANEGRSRLNRWSDVGRYSVVFAVGLGLIGAGLLLGWSLGWILGTTCR